MTTVFSLAEQLSEGDAGWCSESKIMSRTGVGDSLFRVLDLFLDRRPRRPNGYRSQQNSPQFDQPDRGLSLRYVDLRRYTTSTCTSTCPFKLAEYVDFAACWDDWNNKTRVSNIRAGLRADWEFDPPAIPRPTGAD